MKKEDLTRKCGKCKEIIFLEVDNCLYDKRYYHFDCYVEILITRKRNPLSKEDAIIETEFIKQSSKNYTNTIIIKDKLYKWLQRAYDVSVLPKSFYQKMEDIYHGRWHGLSESISPDDIFFIWKKKKNEFDKLNDYQRKHGKSIDGKSRLNYDLAIVLSKYDSYKNWKEQQKIIRQEEKEKTIQSPFNHKAIDKKVTENIRNENDLSNYLEEI